MEPGHGKTRISIMSKTSNEEYREDGNQTHIPEKLVGRFPPQDELTALVSLVVNVIVGYAIPFTRGPIFLLLIGQIDTRIEQRIPTETNRSHALHSSCCCGCDKLRSGWARMEMGIPPGQK